MEARENEKVLNYIEKGLDVALTPSATAALVSELIRLGTVDTPCQQPYYMLPGAVHFRLLEEILGANYFMFFMAIQL